MMYRMGFGGALLDAHALLQLPDGCQNLIAHLRQSRIHQQYTVGSDRNRDVSCGAREHINVPAHRNNLDMWRGLRESGDGRHRQLRTADSCRSSFLARSRVRRPNQFPGRFRIHRVGACHAYFRRQVILLRELSQERVGPRHIVRHVAFRAHYFLDHVARIRRDLLIQRQSIF